jgi:hypothetical protein
MSGDQAVSYMYVTSYPSPLNQNKHRQPKPKPAGFLRGFSLAVAVLLVGAAGFRLAGTHVSAASPAVQSGLSGYCLDAETAPGASAEAVNTKRCDGSSNEAWTVSGLALRHGAAGCLDVVQASTAHGAKVVADACSQAPGQVWLRDRSGYLNPNSGLCLSAPAAAPGQQLIIAACAPGAPGQRWTPVSGGSNRQVLAPADCARLSIKGDKIACYAAQEWSAWQAAAPGHNSLLNSYTDGNGYEEWCADFVSYVYREAGYPLVGGERDGWDEYLAPNVQNAGNFTVHDAASYTPKAGDVAFFDYSGGHVEIVASGGLHPTFIYGDSGTVDPLSGNGDMAANTITDDGAAGQVVYYLSPN